MKKLTILVALFCTSMVFNSVSANSDSTPPSFTGASLTGTERLEQLVNNEVSLVPAKLGEVTVVGSQGKYIATQIFHSFDDLRPKVLRAASSQRWTPGQLVKIWVYPDWTLQVCGNLFRKYDGCAVVNPQNTPSFLKYEIRNMISMLSDRSFGYSKKFIENYIIDPEFRGESKAIDDMARVFHREQKDVFVDVLNFILNKSPVVENSVMYTFLLPEGAGLKKYIRFVWDEKYNLFRMPKQ